MDSQSHSRAQHSSLQRRGAGGGSKAKNRVKLRGVLSWRHNSSEEAPIKHTAWRESAHVEFLLGAAPATLIYLGAASARLFPRRQKAIKSTPKCAITP